MDAFFRNLRKKGFEFENNNLRYAFLILKIVMVDIPFTIFSFINTCHVPNGGVEWKFEIDYRKINLKKQNVLMQVLLLFY